MTPLRLHGTCPACGSTEPLRADGTVVQHTRPRGDYWRTGRCEGTGAAPVAANAPAGTAVPNPTGSVLVEVYEVP